jgi:hypothetical protein
LQRELAVAATVALPDAAGVEKPTLTWSEGKPWLCGRRAKRATCWSMTGTKVDLASDVRLLGRGERLCLQHEAGRLACLRDDASLEKGLEWDVIETYPPLRAIGAGLELGCAQVDAGRVECWWWKQEYADHADAGMAYAGELRGKPERIGGLANVTALSVGAAHACALDSGGKLACWGRVIPEPVRPIEIVQVALTSATAIALGEKHGCGLMNERAWCWGDNSQGQLGQPATLPRSEGPVFIDLPQAVVEIALGDRHTCVRTTDGKVRCYGDSADGRLGRAGHKNQWISEVVGVKDATRVRAGSDMTCAVERGQSVKCWGKLDGARGVERAVTLTELEGASDLGIGPQLVCGLIGDAVRCWNRAKKGDVYSAKARDVVEIAGQCVRSRAGEVYCLELAREEAHDGYRVSVHSLPVSELEGAERIWVGARTVCARSATNASCMTIPREGPTVPRRHTWSVPLAQLKQVVDVAIGAHQMCAVESKGHVWCVGGFDPPTRAPGPESPWTTTPVTLKLP